jgi:hypothetical protein
MLISTVFKEQDGVSMKAEIHDTPDGYTIEYYGPHGLFKTETYHDKSIFYVESAARNWVDGIKVLNG